MEEEVSISIPSISFPSLPSSAGPQMRKVRSDDLIGQQNRAPPTEEVGSGMGMRQNSLEDIADQTMATPTETCPPENVEVCVVVVVVMVEVSNSLSLSLSPSPSLRLLLLALS